MRRTPSRRWREIVVGPAPSGVERFAASIVERLERRTLFALSPEGGEFRVSTYSAGDQDSAALAIDAAGNFVVAWESSAQPGGALLDVYAQRYNAAGVAQGSEFRVNTYTTGDQGSPAVAMDSSGDFVIAWQGAGTGDTAGLYAQRFNAAGQTQGAEFKVNTYTTNAQAVADAAMDADGDFVISWQSTGQDGGNLFDVYAQRYDSAGVAQGIEFRVNTFTTGQQRASAVKMDDSGDFVVAWESATTQPGGDAFDVYAQRYNAAGVPQGVEFRANTVVTQLQYAPALALDSDGDFVVAWQSVNGLQHRIYSQRFDSAGVPQGVESLVNTALPANLPGLTVAMSPDGDYVITWATYSQDGSSYGIYAREYSAAGVAQSTEFLVNTATLNKQTNPMVARRAQGNYVVAWQSLLQDGSGYGVYAQRYGVPIDATPPFLTGVFVNGQSVPQYSVQNGPISQVVIAFSEDMSVAGGPVGANSVTNIANWSVRTLRSGAITDHPISNVTYQFNAATNRFEATIQLASPVAGNIQIIPSNLRDVSGNALDGDMDGLAGGGTAWSFNIGPRRLGSEFRVNSFTTNQQTEPALATDSDGDFVVIWTSDQDGSLTGIYGQRYNANGVAQGSEFQVNTYTTNTQSSPVVAMDSDGDFVVAWQSWNQDGSLSGVYARRFNSAGVAASSEFRVNTSTLISQMNPSVAMDPAGNFVVAWESSHESGDYNIYAQRYNASGVAQGSQFRVNSYTTSFQTRPSVAADSSGAFIVAWQSDGQDGSGNGIYAQSYSGTGSLIGGEFRANAYTTGNQQRPSVARGDGFERFLIVWESAAQDGDDSGIFARYFVSGIALSEFRVNTHTTAAQQRPSVAMETDGGFVVAWDSTGQDTSLTGTYAQRLNFNAEPKGAEFLVNSTTDLDQDTPAVAVDSGGGFVVAWEGSGSGDSDGIFAQRFRFEQLAPAAAALSALPNPVAPPGQLTLSATGVADDESVVAVRFFRESNGVPGFQYGADGDTAVGTDSNGGDGWSVVVPTSGLAAGNHSYWALPIDNIEFLSAPVSAGSTVSVGVSTSVFAYDVPPQKLRFSFNSDVSGSLGLEDINLIRIGGGSVPALTMLAFGTEGTNVATFEMTTSLADGNYRATITSAGVTGMVVDHVFDFFILGGDADHNRIVDARDLLILANNWLGSGKTWSQGDFNSDGLVNQIDLTVMAQGWQQNLAQPAPALPSPALPTSARAPTRTPTRTPVRSILLI